MKISKAEKLLLDFFKIDCDGNCEDCVMANEEIDLCDNISEYLSNRGLVDYGDTIYNDDELEVVD